MVRYTNQDVVAEDFIDRLDEALQAVRPFVEYMSAVLTTNADGESLVKGWLIFKCFLLGNAINCQKDSLFEKICNNNEKRYITTMILPILLVFQKGFKNNLNSFR